MSPLAWSGLLLSLAATCRAAEPLTLFYNERPPYLVTEAGGAVSGLTATPATRALQAAGLDFVWTRTPSNRQLVLLQAGGQRCAVGWFRTAERERHAKFSRPIYRDLPQVAVVRNGFALPPGLLLEQLMAMPGLRLLIKEHYSYGSRIDELIRRFHPTLISTTAENGAMMAMISAKRADLMFVAKEEAAYLAGIAATGQRRYYVVGFADLPDGEERHIICSLDVADEAMRRIDAAIASWSEPR